MAARRALFRILARTTDVSAHQFSADAQCSKLVIVCDKPTEKSMKAKELALNDRQKRREKLLATAYQRARAVVHANEHVERQNFGASLCTAMMRLDADFAVALADCVAAQLRGQAPRVPTMTQTTTTIAGDSLVKRVRLRRCFREARTTR